MEKRKENIGNFGMNRKKTCPISKYIKNEKKRKYLNNIGAFQNYKTFHTLKLFHKKGQGPGYAKHFPETRGRYTGKY